MYRVEDRHWWYTGLRGMLDLAWKHAGLHEKLGILDAGCGTGANLTHLASRGACIGIDFSPDAIRLCRSRGHHETAVASVAALPFAAGSIGVAISCDVLCHRSIPDPLIPLREISNALKPGGVLLVNLPAYQWLYSSHDVHVHTTRRFTKRQVQRMLTSAGFENVYATYWNTILFPLIVVTRLWRKVWPLPASDLEGNSGERVYPILSLVLAVERSLLRFAPMPFGLSVLCVARKRV
ncbi:MAG: class I SAM-dependent methyltransferase [Candidatus Hydrogenedentes bacterium]|nr:class I SAM-dependent methyltransferase [Candidatus Hydrogenedentota bacterium]